MNEKVLGFKEKDCFFSPIGEEGLEWRHLRIGENKLVPVVSVEKLRKICRGLYEKATDTHPTANDLVKAVRLQVVEEKE